MSKQISFFMGQKDEGEFIKSLIECPDILLFSNKLINESVITINSYEQLDSTKVNIGSSISNLLVSSGYIDEISSDIIDFTRSKSWSKKELRPGRLWLKTDYNLENGGLLKKPDWIIKLFDKLAKWVKKNYKKSKCGMYYIGPEALELYCNGWSMKIGPKQCVEFDIGDKSN